MIAFAIRLLATAGVLLFVPSFLFLSGWFVFTPERPGRLRHAVVDWACPRCDVSATAYVSRFWRVRARRRALGMLHRRLSPQCPAADGELLILKLGEYARSSCGRLALLAAVLVTVGIGVGVEAANGPGVYGPIGTQFRAAFPAAPHAKVLRSGSQVLAVYSVTTASGTFIVEVADLGGSPSASRNPGAVPARETMCRADPFFCGWTGYAPLHAVSTPSLCELGLSVCNGGEFFESKEDCRSSMDVVRVDNSDALEVFGYGKFGGAAVPHASASS